MIHTEARCCNCSSRLLAHAQHLGYSQKQLDDYFEKEVAMQASDRLQVRTCAFTWYLSILWLLVYGMAATGP